MLENIHIILNAMYKPLEKRDKENFVPFLTESGN